MSWYIVRVELHQAAQSDYDILHAAMSGRGFSRSLSLRGKTLQLPTAEYFQQNEGAGPAVLAEAQAAARQTGRNFAIIVTEGANFYQSGLSGLP